VRALIEMDTIQIEITNACINNCSNCTRLVGHTKPYFMHIEQVKAGVDYLSDFPNMVGIMGGEPLLHPQFTQICEYALSKIPRERLGLWTCFPKGYELYREVICRTFGNIFLNDHSRHDIFHCPILVAAKEVFPVREEMFLATNHCWVQEAWSAAINPKGAFFCEVAAALSILFEGPHGWTVENGWWKRTPKDFTSQIEEYCPKCGAALPFKRRASYEGIDDISPGNLKRLQGRSLKVKKGLVAVSDLKLYKEPEQMAVYKDVFYRAHIADRYGIFCVENTKGFNTPHLKKDPTFRPPLFEKFKEEYKVKP